jgi:hypothetical protein
MVHRNFQCDSTGQPCTDARCKKGACIIEAQEADAEAKAIQEHAERADASIRNAIPHVAELVAKEILRRNKKRLTRENIKLVARKPEVLAVARRVVKKSAKSVSEH